jgi:hypothetical protein
MRPRGGGPELVPAQQQVVTDSDGVGHCYAARMESIRSAYAPRSLGIAARRRRPTRDGAGGRVCLAPIPQCPCMVYYVYYVY